jgi:hypothetical protein
VILEFIRERSRLNVRACGLGEVALEDRQAEIADVIFLSDEKEDEADASTSLFLPPL